MEIKENGNYIMFEGKKLPLTDEQIEMLKSETKQKKTPFKRAERGKDYYTIDMTGEVISCADYRFGTDDMLFDVANYCTDEKMITQRALHEKLNRLLWKYSMENGETDNPWDSNHQHFYIYFNEKERTLMVDFCCNVHTSCEVYFPTEELADKAITDVVIPFLVEHPEFVW